MDARPNADFAGVDLTPEMLNLARSRLPEGVAIFEQDIIELDLKRDFETIFCVGGIWYVVEGSTDGEKRICSHVADLGRFCQSVASVSRHIRPGGRLMLSIQGPHEDGCLEFSQGFKYQQKLSYSGQTFKKSYIVEKDEEVLCDMMLEYRLILWDEAVSIFDKFGLEFIEKSSLGQFYVFAKRPAQGQND